MSINGTKSLPAPGKEKYKKLTTARKKEFAFFLALVAFPIAQFLVFYVVVNINSILLAFKTFDPNTAEYHFSGFNNFELFFHNVARDATMKVSIRNSLLLYASGLFIGLPLNLLFSYFLYKKIPGTKFFRIILFLPQILASIVMSTMFKYFAGNGFLALMERFGVDNPPILFVDSPYAIITIIFYNIWAGFGAQLLIYSSAMGRVPDSVIEYGKIDGIGPLREFLQIIMPLIFPTVMTFLIVGIASIFTHQASLYNFFGSGALPKLRTLGYTFFVLVVGGESSFPEYPYASAGGLVFTAIAIPLTLGVKYVLEKLSPVTEY